MISHDLGLKKSKHKVKRQVRAITKKVTLIYGSWVLCWTCLAVYGSLFTSHGEYGVISHIWLLISGLPLSLLLLEMMPNGSIPGVIVAGIAGCLQWCIITEFGARRSKDEGHRKK